VGNNEFGDIGLQGLDIRYFIEFDFTGNPYRHLFNHLIRVGRTRWVGGGGGGGGCHDRIAKQAFVIRIHCRSFKWDHFTSLYDIIRNKTNMFGYNNIFETHKLIVVMHVTIECFQ
jgi:hypothetical protein